MPHFTCNYSSWWNTQDQQISQTLSKNINFRVENSPQHRQDKGSPSTQSSSQSIHDLNGAGSTTCQDLCVSSSQPVHAQIYQKRVDEQVKSTFELSNPEFSINTSEMDTNQSTISFAAYTDPYYNSLFNGYGPQAIIQSQMVGMAPTRIPLPPDLAQDGPIYVNARQYRGILRRRQIRAKLEAQNKLVKNRKPYLHESRHLHAVKRVRGTGGRFLSKQQQQSVDTVQTNMHNHKEDHDTSSTVATNAATTTSTTSIGYTGGGSLNLMFEHHPPPDNSVSSRMTLGGGFSGNERWHTTAGSSQ